MTRQGVTVTTQESLDGIRGEGPEDCNPRRVGGMQQCRKMVQFRRSREVRAIVGQITKEGHSRRLWQQVKTVERLEKRAIQNWNMKHVDIARSPGSAVRVFISSERTGKSVEDQRDWRSWKIGEEDPDE